MPADFLRFQYLLFKVAEAAPVRCSITLSRAECAVRVDLSYRAEYRKHVMSLRMSERSERVSAVTVVPDSALGRGYLTQLLPTDS